MTHDFRSDTVTLPTPAMMAAIARAPLGDSGRGDDPTVNALEALARRLTGKEDALYVPSCTMANLTAVIGHECRGGEAIVEANAHIYNSEGGGVSAVAGALVRPVPGAHGVLDPQAVRDAIVPAGGAALAPTRVICMENTHNGAGGTVTPIATMQAIHAVARAAGVPVHLDGARLFNAAAYLDVPIRALCDHADSVAVALCKGLGGPVGAIVAGEGAFMKRVRRAAKMLGGSMRQAGIIAAPALVALEDPYPQHRRDHALARRLAEGLAAIEPSLVDLAHVQTNIVNCYVDRFVGPSQDATEFNRALAVRGILANAKRTKIRFVTHSQVDDRAVDALLAAVADVAAGFPKGRS